MTSTRWRWRSDGAPFSVLASFVVERDGRRMEMATVRDDDSERSADIPAAWVRHGAERVA